MPRTKDPIIYIAMFLFGVLAILAVVVAVDASIDKVDSMCKERLGQAWSGEYRYYGENSCLNKSTGERRYL